MVFLKKNIPILYLMFKNNKAISELWHVLHYEQYGNTGCGVFKKGIQNQKDFWLKINCSHIFEFWELEQWRAVKNCNWESFQKIKLFKN